MSAACPHCSGAHTLSQCPTWRGIYGDGTVYANTQKDALIAAIHREERRWSKAKRFDAKYEYEFPLVERGWNKAECQAAIARVGLPPPGKSACFFCPASTVPEINELKTEHPLLFQRALAMEANARLTTVKGLGRRFAWSDLSQAHDEAIEVCRSCIDN